MHRNWMTFAIAALLAVAGTAQAQNWKPADGPLMTRWAKDVTTLDVHKEYPRPQMLRKDWVNLNGLWDYAVVGRDAARPQKFDGQILVPFPIESALSGVMKRVDEKSRLWYRRAFMVPASYAGQRTLLHFGAVDWQAVVSIDGREVGRHEGGYDGFTFDVTDAVTPGKAQELTVAVYDATGDHQPHGKQVRNPGGIMYTPTTGIWQTVWLEPVPMNYIRGLKITPDYDNQSVTIGIDVGGKAGGAVVSVTDPSGQGAPNVQGVTDVSKPVVVKIPDMKPWTPQTPNLYGLTVTLLDNNLKKDEVQSYFGMRKISIAKDDKGVNRIMLNNKPVFMVGPLDQGFWPDGLYTAPTDEALRYDIEITKRLGFNCTRKHVKVEPDRWYYWCDKLGLLVWQDMPSGNSVWKPQGSDRTIFEREMEALVNGRYNHPSIIMWVVFNEGWGEPNQAETTRLVKWVKSLDPSRLANPASGWTDYPVGDVKDMHHYPAPAAPALDPDRAIVLGEFGGLGLPIEGHMWTSKHWGYQGMADTAGLTRKYVNFLRSAWALRDSAGLNGVIYTQITDVETEANGLLSYDRAVIKVDPEQAARANRGDFPPLPERKAVVMTSQAQPQTWHYTTGKPADDWNKPGFDDGAWKVGPGGFGTRGTPGSVVRTEWRTPDIWIRREFTLNSASLKEPLLLMHHDEDAEVYINGVLAAKTGGYTTSYEDLDIRPEALKALKSGKNVIAVHCHQTGGGQYIDVGITEVK